MNTKWYIGLNVIISQAISQVIAKAQHTKAELSFFTRSVICEFFFL